MQTLIVTSVSGTGVFFYIEKKRRIFSKEGYHQLLVVINSIEFFVSNFIVSIQVVLPAPSIPSTVINLPLINLAILFPLIEINSVIMFRQSLKSNGSITPETKYKKVDQMD